MLEWALAGVRGIVSARVRVEGGAGLGGRVVGVAAGAGVGAGAGAGADGMVVGGDARRIYVRGKGGARVWGC